MFNLSETKIGIKLALHVCISREEMCLQFSYLFCDFNTSFYKLEIYKNSILFGIHYYSVFAVVHVNA